MNVKAWKTRNWFRKLRSRVTHPWPVYRRVGGINAVVIRADGTRENLGRASDAYAKRWGVGSGK